MASARDQMVAVTAEVERTTAALSSFVTHSFLFFSARSHTH
jgi:hypothetical protein